jgi:hypothetical protein
VANSCISRAPAAEPKEEAPLRFCARTDGFVIYVDCLFRWHGGLSVTKKTDLRYPLRSPGAQRMLQQMRVDLTGLQVKTEIKVDDPVARSFCGKTQDEANLIAGPKAIFICDECVDISLKTFSKGALNLRAGYFDYETVAKALWLVASALRWWRGETEPDDLCNLLHFTRRGTRTGEWELQHPPAPGSGRF